MKSTNPPENTPTPEGPRTHSRRNFLQGAAAVAVATGGMTATARQPGKAADDRSNTGTKSPQLTAPEDHRKLGSLKVSSIGLGCMSMTSGTYNPPRTKEEMIPVIRGRWNGV